MNRLPLVCEPCRRMVLCLAGLAPAVPCLREVARELDCARWELGRSVGLHGFPPVPVLKDWIRLLKWLFEWDRRRIPLERQAFAAEMEPSVCHRTIRRVTGRTWCEARDLGFEHWAVAFRTQVLGEVRCGFPDGPESRTPPEDA